VAMAGLLAGYPQSQAGTFVLQLPIDHGQRWLAMLVFVGGFSAATGMIVVSSMAMATMLTNHILLPVVAWIEWLSFLRRHLLGCRWVMVACFVGVGYWSQRYISGTYLLENIGMMSFAAVLQFAPCVLGGLFWPRGNETGARLGLAAGFALWVYTLVIPAFVRSGWIAGTILDPGPFGLTFLRPDHLLGIESMHSVTHAVFWSMTFNVGLYVIGSLLARPGSEEEQLAQDFVSITSESSRREPRKGLESHIDLAQKRRMIQNLFQEYFGYARARDMTRECIAAVGLKERTGISILELAELKGRVEKILAGSLGAPQAHKVVTDHFIFSTREQRELSVAYSEILAELKLTPEELADKIDYYEAREKLLTRHAEELEDMVSARTRDLQVAQEELMKREKLSVLGQLTAFVSHELRNPLGVIRSSVYILGRRFHGKDSRTEKHLEKIENEVSRCDSIVEELLEFTRGRRLVTVPRNLNLWLRHVLEQMTPPDGILLSYQPDAALPEVHFDKKKMQSAIQNVITNSYQALKTKLEAANGTRDFVPTVEVRTAKQGNHLVIEVKDNGIGMGDEIIRRAFEPLFTSKARGTGLGLPIVAQIAEAHGGSVTLTSKPDHGTTVTLVIPIARDRHDI
jgi:signal transduction histidine kinase